MFGKTQFHRSPRIRLRAAVIAVILTARAALAVQVVNLAWNPNPEADVVGYRVHVGGQRGKPERMIDVAAATTASIGGLRDSTTYFFSVQAYNSQGLTSPLSAEIAVTTGSTPDFLANWAHDGGLRGSDAEAGAVPHSDGVPNLVKYAFGLRADRHDRRMLAAGHGTAGLPLFRPVTLNGQRWFELQYVRLRDGELSYRPKLSADLVNWSPLEAPETVSAIDATWERVVQRVPIHPSTAPRLFGVVEVTVMLTPRKAYDRWAENAGLTGLEALPSGTPMDDGVPNLVKYAFNLQPTEPASALADGGTAGLPRAAFTRESGRPVFRIEYLRRKDSGLIYSPEVSSDMTRFTPMAGAMSTAEIGDGWEKVTISMDLGATPPKAMFARVSVSLP